MLPILQAWALSAGKDCTEIVKKAFEKQLAIAKVGMECELKLSKLAQENSDSHTCFFVGGCTEQKARPCRHAARLRAHRQAQRSCMLIPMQSLHPDAASSFAVRYTRKAFTGSQAGSAGARTLQ